MAEDVIKTAKQHIIKLVGTLDSQLNRLLEEDLHIAEESHDINGDWRIAFETGHPSIPPHARLVAENRGGYISGYVEMNHEERE